MLSYPWYPPPTAPEGPPGTPLCPLPSLVLLLVRNSTPCLLIFSLSSGCNLELLIREMEAFLLTAMLESIFDRKSLRSSTLALWPCPPLVVGTVDPLPWLAALCRGDLVLCRGRDMGLPWQLELLVLKIKYYQLWSQSYINSHLLGSSPESLLESLLELEVEVVELLGPSPDIWLSVDMVSEPPLLPLRSKLVLLGWTGLVRNLSYCNLYKYFYDRYS